MIVEVDTARLRLRQWRESDREPFAALNADPAVMEFFLSPLSRESSDASIDAWQSQLASRGWSNWALDLKARHGSGLRRAGGRLRAARPARDRLVHDGR